MTMPTQTDFLEILAPKDASVQSDVQTATVVSVANGVPAVKFDGSEAASQKRYPVFKSYQPEAGDRVLIVNGVIIGGWKYD